jgi:hypothetical protein
MPGAWHQLHEVKKVGWFGESHGGEAPSPGS